MSIILQERIINSLLTSHVTIIGLIASDLIESLEP